MVQNLIVTVRYKINTSYLKPKSDDCLSLDARILTFKIGSISSEKEGNIQELIHEQVGNNAISEIISPLCGELQFKFRSGKLI